MVRKDGLYSCPRNTRQRKPSYSEDRWLEETNFTLVLGNLGREHHPMQRVDGAQEDGMYSIDNTTNTNNQPIKYSFL